METKQRDFLYQLLNTASPSGMEEQGQRNWINYVKTFADKVDTDRAGNAIAAINPNADFKVLLAGHGDEIGFMIKYIDDKGFLYVEKVGGISPKLAPGMVINIFTESGTIQGVFGVVAEHQGGLGDKPDFNDIAVDCGFTSKEDAEKVVSIGDFAVYNTEIVELSHNRISARGLDNRSGSFIIAEVLRQLKARGCGVAVYAVSTVGEETNMNGAYFASAGIQPDLGMIFDVTFANDYPGTDPKKAGDIKVDGGPALAIGSTMNKPTNQLIKDVAKKQDINLQIELVPGRSGTDGDRVRYAGTGVPITLISLPLRYMHAPIETISINDIDAVIKLTVESIIAMGSGIELRPTVI